MNDFDAYLAQVGADADKRRPMTTHEWWSLISGLGIPLAFLAALISFCPR